MITYNSPKFNNIYEKNKEILLNNNINIDDAEQIISDDVLDLIARHISECLEPAEKFVSVECPKCKKKHLIPMQLYKRKVIFKIGNILIKIQITLPRLICTNCKSTHITLPSFCVPFKQYSKQAILEIATEANATSSQETADSLNIEDKQVRRFVNIVKSFANDINLLWHKSPDTFKKNNSQFKFGFIEVALSNEFEALYFEEFKSIYLYIKCNREIYMNFKKIST